MTLRLWTAGKGEDPLLSACPSSCRPCGVTAGTVRKPLAEHSCRWNAVMGSFSKNISQRGDFRILCRVRNISGAYIVRYSVDFLNKSESKHHPTSTRQIIKDWQCSGQYVPTVRFSGTGIPFWAPSYGGHKSQVPPYQCLPPHCLLHSSPYRARKRPQFQVTRCDLRNLQSHWHRVTGTVI